MTTPAETPVAPGARIVHPELGPGTVRRLRRDGRALKVNFDSHPRLLLEVKRVEVAAEKPAPLADTGARAEKTRPAKKNTTVPRPPFRRTARTAAVREKDSDAAARALEALRLGVVPHGDLRASSVGRDAEMRAVRKDLDETATSGSTRVFLGDYGTGKTHLLELIEVEALARGFLVGRATLDAQYARPNHPMRVYRQLVSTLRYPDSGDASQPGLQRLFDRVLDGKGTDDVEDHLYLRPALHYYAQVATAEDPLPRDLLLDWVSGQRPEGNQELDATLRSLGRRGPTIYSLKDFQPWAHVYAYLLGGLGTLARAAGYRGLVLLLDEAENYDLLGSAARVFADSLFRCLVLAALGPAHVRFSPETLEKGGFPPQKRLPVVFREAQHLYLVSAMTPSTAGEELLRALVPPERLTELMPLSPDDYQELSRRLSVLFQTAYPQMLVPETLNRPLAEVLWALLQREHIRTPREATKLTVEFLDLLRLRPEDIDTFFRDVERALG